MTRGWHDMELLIDVYDDEADDLAAEARYERADDGYDPNDIRFDPIER